jgi:hypothetical protein
LVSVSNDRVGNRMDLISWAVVETVHFGISVSIARGTVGVRSPEAAIQISSSIMGEMITRCFTVNMGYTQMLHSLPAWSVLCSFMFAQ